MRVGGAHSGNPRRHARSALSRPLRTALAIVREFIALMRDGAPLTFDAKAASAYLKQAAGMAGGIVALLAGGLLQFAGKDPCCNALGESPCMGTWRGPAT